MQLLFSVSAAALAAFTSITIASPISGATELAASASFPAAVLGSDGRSSVADDVSLLQQPFLAPRSDAGVAADAAPEPFRIGLRRESVPVYRRGKIASYKTSYSGVVHVGSPVQEFRVVFDTGSGHLVLPAAECRSEACLVEGRRKFDMRSSSTSVAINTDGTTVAEGEACDQVTIGFGTGEITGEFARDRVCFGMASHEEHPPSEAHVIGEPHPQQQAAGSMRGAASSSAPEWAVAATGGSAQGEQELCVEMSIVLAVEMSSQPFKTFQFDGILGLGLSALALNGNFSTFQMLLGRGLPAAHFGVFLTEGEDGEESEIAVGGADTRRMLEPLHWAPVMLPEHGHWQVQILAVRINGKELDICRDGTCRGVVDTGTSHLGVPAPADQEFGELLTREAGDLLDCRIADAPEVEIEVPGYTMTLRPHNYMRRLPLREGVSVSSAKGVHLTEAGSQPAPDAGSASPEAAPADVPAGAEVTAAQEEVRRYCRPRLMPVRLPAPLGPKLFILGEPVLHRYYTVYDWEKQRVGFSLANSRRNTVDPSELMTGRGTLPKEVDVLLMQQSVKVTKASAEGAEIPEEATVFLQVELTVAVRRRPC